MSFLCIFDFYDNDASCKVKSIDIYVQWYIQKVILDVYGTNLDLFILYFYDNDV